MPVSSRAQMDTFRITLYKVVKSSSAENLKSAVWPIINELWRKCLSSVLFRQQCFLAIRHIATLGTSDVDQPIDGKTLIKLYRYVLMSAERRLEKLGDDFLNVHIEPELHKSLIQDSLKILCEIFPSHNFALISRLYDFTGNDKIREFTLSVCDLISERKPRVASAWRQEIETLMSSRFVTMEEFSNGKRMIQFKRPAEAWFEQACFTFGLEYDPCVSVNPPWCAGVLTRYSKPKKWRSVAADGHCGFRSLSYIVTGTEGNHSKFRKVICQYTADHADKFEELMEYRDDAEFRRDAPSTCVGIDYYMNTNDLISAATLLRCTIGVFTPVGIQLYNKSSFDSCTYGIAIRHDETEPLILIDNQCSSHFNPVFETDDEHSRL